MALTKVAAQLLSVFGYGAGQGGTVTQLTSKSTPIALNTPTGRITMNGAALAAGATVQFQMINTSVSSGDICVVSIVSATSATTYQLSALVTGNTSVYFGLRNMTGSSFSEALIFNFAIIKGSTS